MTNHRRRSEEGRPIQAIPIRGVWDQRQGVPGAGGRHDAPGMFTFACRGFALAKCVEFGYEPWRHGTDLHQACVRMVRADFCGDGRSWTENGTLINLYDHRGIQQDEADWPVEAEWDVHGARCLRPGGYRVHRPACHDELATYACGGPGAFERGTLLITEVP